MNECFTYRITYRNKKQYLDEIRQRIIDLIEESGVDKNSTNSVYGFIRKGKTSNYGFKSYWMKCFSKKFHSREAEILIKRDYDLILGKGVNDIEENLRLYKLGINIEALKAFDEIMKPLNDRIGYEIEINKKISLEDIDILYDYIIEYPQN